jgi:hypothetical protein
MNNMRIFSKSDKDEKDKNRDITLPIYSVSFKGGVSIQIIAEIHRLNGLFDGILSVPGNKKGLDYLKEKFGKYIDEKEIEKVFLLYMFGISLIDALEAAAKYLSSLSTINSLGYYLYRDENILGGKLDEKTFRELIWKINEYAKSVSSNENKEQKDEQSK